MVKCVRGVRAELNSSHLVTYEFVVGDVFVNFFTCEIQVFIWRKGLCELLSTSLFSIITCENFSLYLDLFPNC